MYKLVEEGQRQQDRGREDAKAELQGVWSKLLEVMADLDMKECYSECPSPTLEFTYIIYIDLVNAAFPGYLEQFLDLSEQEKDRLTPFAQRMVLDKVHSVLLACGFYMCSTFSITSPTFTFAKSQLRLRFCVADPAAEALSELFCVYMRGDKSGIIAITYAVQYWANMRGLGDTLKAEICFILVIAYLQYAKKLPCIEPKVGYSRTDYPNLDPMPILLAETSLFEIFRYYGGYFEWQRDYVSILPREKQLKRENGWESSLFAIECPLDKQINLTSDLSKEEAKALIDEFRLAYQLLGQGNSFQSVCSHSR
jgi:hypothetical protein